MPDHPPAGGAGRYPSTRFAAILNDLVADWRFTARTLARNRGFAAAAILSLALGVGANTAIFSVVNALLLRPAPYADADRLTVLWNRSPGLGIEEDWFSTAQYFDVKNGHHGFEQLGIAIGAMANLTGQGEPERVGAVRVSSSLLPMLGVTAAQGRLFVPDDDKPGRTGAAILTHGMWMRRYGGRPGVVGQSLTLNGQPFGIVGVLPAAFSLPREVLPLLYGGEVTELFLPLPLTDAAPNTRTREDFNIVGKLKPGVPLAQAQSEMDAITARLCQEHPEVYPPNGGLTFSLVPMLEQAVGGVRLRLYVLMGAVGFVLLVACANAANLLLARTLARHREFAVRAAFGGSSGRMIRQVLAESTLVGLCGGAAGVALAYWSLGWLRAFGPKTIPRLAEVNVDWRVLVFSLALSVGSGVVSGLVPALRVSRADLMSALKQAGRSSSLSAFGRGHRTRRLLVVAELALSVLLLIGAGLLIRSFANLQGVHPGFNPRGVLTFALQLAGQQYNGPQPVLATYRQILERLDRLPGVRASGGCTALPLSDSPSWTPITIEGRTPPPGEQFVNTDERVAAGRYFEAMGIPLLKGRLFDDRDVTGAPGVVVVDERFAQEFWPAGDAVGRRIRRGGLHSQNPWLTVVGVVGRVKHQSLDDNPRIAMYLPHGQAPTRAMTVVVRATTDVEALAGPIRRTIGEVDAALPLYLVRTMEQYVGLSLARQRFTVILLTVFAVIALALAAVGTYGVMAYLVGQGTRDIGIRMALGASRGRILAMVVRQGTWLAAAGVGAGLAGAFALSRFLAALLFGVSAHDPVTFASVPVLLGAVALIACYVPARRAARVDPAVSLVCE